MKHQINQEQPEPSFYLLMELMSTSMAPMGTDWTPCRHTAKKECSKYILGCFPQIKYLYKLIKLMEH